MRKVLSFIEWFYENAKDNESMNSCFSAFDFYNQPFSVEMVMDKFGHKEYPVFRLWKKLDTGHFLYQSREFLFADNSMRIRLNSYNAVTETPKTLNDFITLCNLAGIELQWNSNNQKVKVLGL